MPYFLADNFNVGENGELVRKTLAAKPKTVAAKAAAPPNLSLLQRRSKGTRQGRRKRKRQYKKRG